MEADLFPDLKADNAWLAGRLKQVRTFLTYERHDSKYNNEKKKRN